MPSLAKHHSTKITKMILEGDPGTGKTGGLTSLVKAGYFLRILDYDNNLGTLRQYVQKECPDKIDNVESRALRDKLKASQGGPVIDGSPIAFIEGLKMLDNWKYQHEGETIDLGRPGAWGEDTILVIDSLTTLSDAAFAWARSLNPAAKEPRTWYYAAQTAIKNVISLLTSESFGTNVIVISHIRYVDREVGGRKGYPNTVGTALGEILPAYFNSVALTETKGDSKVVRTASTAMIDLKSPAPFKMAKELPLSTGLADFFATVRS